MGVPTSSRWSSPSWYRRPGRAQPLRNEMHLLPRTWQLPRGLPRLIKLFRKGTHRSFAEGEMGRVAEKICRVLIVEDRPEIQELLSEVFADQGYRFGAVTNGGEMRKALVAGDVDVAVIDVVLPGPEDGLALAKEVAAQGVGVILVTGRHDHFETGGQSGHRYLFK